MQKSKLWNAPSLCSGQAARHIELNYKQFLFYNYNGFVLHFSYPIQNGFVLRNAVFGLKMGLLCNNWVRFVKTVRSSLFLVRRKMILKGWISAFAGMTRSEVEMGSFCKKQFLVCSS